MVPTPRRRTIRSASASSSIGRVAAVAVARAMQRGTAMRRLGQCPRYNARIARRRPRRAPPFPFLFSLPSQARHAVWGYNFITPNGVACLRRQKPMPAVPAQTSRCPGGACTLLFDVPAVPAPRHARCLRRQKPMPAVPAPTARCTGGACTLLFDVPAVPAPLHAGPAPTSRCPRDACT